MLPGKTGDIFVVPSNGGEARIVYTAKERGDLGLYAGLSWTPNSNALLFAGRSGKEHEIMYLPVNSGPGESKSTAPRSIGVRMEAIRSINLRPDGKQIGFSGSSAIVHVWTLRNFFSNVRAAR
jgi:hypothetical protein